MQKLIEKKLNTKIHFTLNRRFFSSFKKIKNNTIFFATNIDKKIILKINKINCGILITDKFVPKIKHNIIQIIKKNPKYFFFNLINNFYKYEIKIKKPMIGSGSRIDKNVKIGNNVKIGKNCKIFSGVVIHNDVSIGDNCIIKSNSVIGQRGFGVIKNSKGFLIQVPQVGKVKIHSNVEIGALNTVARGTIDSTIIESYNKFDDHVHIAHNCIIKKNNTICASVVFGGSVEVGEDNFFGLNAVIKNKIKIGNKNLIGQSTNVIKDIKNNSIIFGNPGKKS